MLGHIRHRSFLDRPRRDTHNPARMKRPAIFFDRDNTLIVSDGYLGDPAQVVLVDGAADAVAAARDMGYAVVVFSNQSGVARGLFAEEDVHAVNARMDEMLRAANPNAVIDRHEFCPFHPEATLEEYRRESDLRKPRPGMIHAAAERLGLDLSRSWVIGDAPRDVEAGRAAGCRTILLRDPSLRASPAAQAPLREPPDRIVSSLTEAIAHVRAASEPLHQRVHAQPVPRALRDPADDDDDDDDIPIITTARFERAAEGGNASQPRQEFLENSTKLERLAEQILHELRRRRDEPNTDFSVPRLMAGITQVITLAILFMSYLNRATPNFQSLLLVALFFQTFTISLLIMGRLR
jgi:D-glycero-D-manno-heptose 1,7-bisphosphate phosphatase